MNTFGRIFRVSIFGESHGNCVGVLIDGVPAGLKLVHSDLKKDMARRNPGIIGTTARKECDIPDIRSGVFNGITTGAPILIIFENQDVRSKDYEALTDTPRPGHADFTANIKFGGFNDYRGGGHLSGRLTAGLVAAGTIAKKILGNIKIDARLIEAGGNKKIEQEIKKTYTNKDSIGGVVECRINKLPTGLGEPFFDSVESVISHIVFAIPGIKGIEFGTGFRSAELLGSEYNDRIIDRNGKTKTNNSGGINGGITNGNEVIFRIAVRPSASIAKQQETINLKTGKSEKIFIQGRHDTCFAVRIPVIIEAVSAIAIADLMMLEQKVPRVVR
ncbi:MAG: chorismate synthase [Proteobacteria bacterium]|nr:chorismate synthase [Pseudomonadota bacterium]